MQELLSVVVPVYNKEETIKKCIDSILNQKYPWIELIIVDDGSSDRSRKIIIEERKKDKRIKSFFQENAGVSSARNVGIQEASGKYIVFIDADDIVLPDMFMKMIDKMNQCDMCACNMYRVEKNRTVTQAYHKDIVYDLTNLEKKNDYFVNCLMGKHSYCVWNKMYKLDLIREKEIAYLDNNLIYPEDLQFNLFYISQCNQVYWLDEPLYYHTYNKKGLSKQDRKDVTRRYLNVCEEYKTFLKKYSLFDSLYNSFCFVVQRVFITNMIYLVRDKKLPFAQFRKQVEAAYQFEFFRDAMNNGYYTKGTQKEDVMRQMLAAKNLNLYCIMAYYVVRNGFLDEITRKKDFFTVVATHEEDEIFDNQVIDNKIILQYV